MTRNLTLKFCRMRTDKQIRTETVFYANSESKYYRDILRSIKQKSGARTRIGPRTLGIFNPLLYRLSYPATGRIKP